MLPCPLPSCLHSSNARERAVIRLNNLQSKQLSIHCQHLLLGCGLSLRFDPHIICQNACDSPGSYILHQQRLCKSCLGTVSLRVLSLQFVGPKGLHNTFEPRKPRFSLKPLLKPAVRRDQLDISPRSPYIVLILIFALISILPMQYADNAHTILS